MLMFSYFGCKDRQNLSNYWLSISCFRLFTIKIHSSVDESIKYFNSFCIFYRWHPLKKK